MPLGYGIAPYGVSGYGVPVPSDLLQLLAAEPWAENVVRLTFNRPVYYSQLLDPQDASARDRYSITPIAGSLDGAGQATRPVLPAWAAQSGGGGTLIDLTVDRPFSSWPSRYLVAINHLRAGDMTPLDLTHTSVGFDGLQYELGELAGPSVTAGGDFANPQTGKAASQGTAATPEQAAILGSFVVSSDGDYTIDRGVESYKKRIIRRLLSEVGGFAYLSKQFGLRANRRQKKLFRRTDAAKLCAQAEAQVRADPETANCSVTLVPVVGQPNIAYLQVRAQHVTGGTVSESVPILIGGS